MCLRLRCASCECAAAAVAQGDVGSVGTRIQALQKKEPHSASGKQRTCQNQPNKQANKRANKLANEQTRKKNKQTNKQTRHRPLTM